MDEFETIIRSEWLSLHKLSVNVKSLIITIKNKLQRNTIKDDINYTSQFSSTDSIFKKTRRSTVKFSTLKLRNPHRTFRRKKVTTNFQRGNSNSFRLHAKENVKSKQDIDKFTEQLNTIRLHEAQTSGPFCTDRLSNEIYLIDTGAYRSFYPISFLPERRLSDPNSSIKAANKTKIITYGTINKELDLGLGQIFKWEFLVADIERPIIGDDFIVHYDIIIHRKKNKILIADDFMSCLYEYTQKYHKICNKFLDVFKFLLILIISVVYFILKVEFFLKSFTYENIEIQCSY
ncbi:uncharacterized protein LOC130675673 [Microplitis mediator]|uniref:uncharacterized protein LOC130675673 n=1 Tax=Microplitis mediator TaxID=375433 RepID=UPI00255233ED|nr:uncharacterized protein LOC130675673 [Microplitis mediator]XP_057337478.1 uncharacterized protein LOC130675673 [Microplitis mediator]